MVHIHIEGPFQVEKSIQDSIYIGQIIKCILSWSTLICRAVFHIFLSRAQTEQIARRVVVISVLHVEKSKTGVFLPRVLIRHTFSISRWVTQRSVRATQRTADAANHSSGTFQLFRSKVTTCKVEPRSSNRALQILRGSV